MTKARESDAAQPANLLGRRDLLASLAWVGLGTSAIGGLLLGLRTLWPRSRKASALRLSAGRASDYAIGQVSGELLREHWVWVVRSPEGFYALSARCSHLGCRLRYVPARREFHCMCHGSAFSQQGELLRGPAARDLERVFIALSREGMLWVDPTVRYRREHGEWGRPGAFQRYPARGQRGA